MSVEVADLYVLLDAKTASFRSNMLGAAAVGESAGKRIESVAKAGKAISLGVIGVGVASLDAASKFDAAMERIHTQARAPQAEVDALKQKVLDLAGKVGQAPLAIADALYHVESVGYRAAGAMDVVTEASKLAAISGADLETVTYGLTSVMQSYGAKATDAAKYAAFFNSVVGAGDMKMQDFSAAIGTGFFSAAQTFGVSMESAGAALAFMTDRGSSAEESSTRLRMSLALMAAPSAKASKLLIDLGMAGPQVTAATTEMTDALRKAGLTTTTLSEDLRKPDGFFVALTDLKQHLVDSGLSADAASALISHAFGGGRSDAAILGMVNNLAILRSKFDAVNTGVANYGADWTATQQQFQQQWKQAKASVEAMAVSLGNVLIPKVQATVAWFEKHKQVTKDLAYLLGVTAVGAVVLWVGTVISKLALAGFQILKFVTSPIRSMITSTAEAGAAMTRMAEETTAAVNEEATATETASTRMVAALERNKAAMLGAGASAGTMAAETTAADAEVTAANDTAAASGGRMGGALGLAGKSGKIGALGILGFAGAVGFAGKSLSNYLERNNSAVKALNTLGGSVDVLNTALVNNQGATAEVSQQWLQGQIQSLGLANKAARSGITIDQMTKAIMGGSAATQGLIAQWKASGKPSNDTLFALTLLQQSYQGTANKVSILAAGMKGIPPKVLSKLFVNDMASGPLQQVIAELETLQANSSVTLDINVVANRLSTINSQVPAAARAAGGFVFGPGTSTSDSIPARLSNGEYVLSAAMLSGRQPVDPTVKAAITSGGQQSMVSGASGGGAVGGDTYIFKLIVNGALLDGPGLVRIVQQEFTRHGGRNKATYQQYARR